MQGHILHIKMVDRGTIDFLLNYEVGFINLTNPPPPVLHFRTLFSLEQASVPPPLPPITTSPPQSTPKHPTRGHLYLRGITQRDCKKKLGSCWLAFIQNNIFGGDEYAGENKEGVSCKVAADRSTAE